MASQRTLTILLILAVCGISARGQTIEPRSGPALNSLLSNLVGQAGHAATELGNTIKPIVTSMADLKEQLANQYVSLSQQVDQVLNIYEAEYCVPAKFAPSRVKPAQFVGQGFSLTFSTGACYFNSTAYHTEGLKVLNCTEPGIQYVQSPANFTSKHHSAPVYTSKYCQISKSFGEPMEKVLHVFDGVSQTEMQALTEKITAEVQDLLGSLNHGVTSSIQGLVSTLGGLEVAANKSTVAAASTAVTSVKV